MAKKKTSKKTAKKASKKSQPSSQKSRIDPIKDFMWQPGQSGNPSGRPPLPPELRAFKELTNQEVKRYFAKYSRMSVEEVKEAAADQSLPMIEAVIASGYKEALFEGDFSRLNFVLNRTIGKVSDKVEVELPKPFVIKSRAGEEITLGAKREDDGE